MSRGYGCARRRSKECPHLRRLRCGRGRYALPELATAVQHGIDVVALVFVAGALGASKNDQRTRYAGRMVGTDLHNPSFARVAEVFGARGIRADPHELGRAVHSALEARRPTVIEVPIPTLPPPFQLRRGRWPSRSSVEPAAIAAALVAGPPAAVKPARLTVLETEGRAELDAISRAAFETLLGGLREAGIRTGPPSACPCARDRCRH